MTGMPESIRVRIRLGRRVIGGAVLGAALLGLAASGPVAARCGAETTHAVHEAAAQGGAPGVEPGQRVVLRGIVTGVFVEPEALHGFFIQGEDPAPDRRASGLFVYLGDAGDSAGPVAALEAWDGVVLEGRVDRFHGRRQVRALEGLARCARDRPVRVEQPPGDEAGGPDWSHREEGLRVRWERDLIVTGNDELARYGTLRLSAPGRLFRPTNFPGRPEVLEARPQIVLDDGSYQRGPDPVPYLDDEDTRRVGSRIRGLEGIVTRAFGEWRVYPVGPVRFRNDNPRPAPLSPPPEDSVRVAAFNVENYFLTLGERGASTEAELRAQREKLLAAAGSLQADVLALIELENDDRAAEDFVRRLRRSTGDPWQRVTGGGDTGTDAIRVELAYRSDRVEALDRVERDSRRVHHRPPQIEAFRPREGGDAFGVLAMHAKAKVGCPPGGDVDRGQGCWNERRVLQARAKLEAIERWRSEGDHGTPVLIAGDLNAYGGEDPVRELSAGGKRDLLRAHLPPGDRYSYVFRGESGYLDHLLAPERLARRVRAVRVWSANADEPPFLAYDEGGPDGRYREAHPWRASDHDPVVVDLGIHEKTR